MLHLNHQLGLNPNFTPMKALYDAGHLAAGAGGRLPNPNRSHFRSTDIWTGAATSSSRPAGWGVIDNTCSGEDKPLKGVDVGDTVFKLFCGWRSIVPAISSIEAFDFLTDTRFPNDRNNQIDTFKASTAGPAATTTTTSSVAPRWKH